jgi:hypothetical protein
MPSTLLTTNNPKVEKSVAFGYLTSILHLAPARTSGYNVCPNHSAECAAHCLSFVGRGVYQKTKAARIRKTLWYFKERDTFLSQLSKEIAAFSRRSKKLNLKCAVRLNGTSDIRWELHNIMEHHPTIMFYDYTKIPNRRNLPANYRLTYSFSGDNLSQCVDELANGNNVAVPFINRPLVWQGYPVIDGDQHDLRFLDPTPCVVGLRAKGILRRHTRSPFLGDNHS